MSGRVKVALGQGYPPRSPRPGPGRGEAPPAGLPMPRPPPPWPRPGESFSMRAGAAPQGRWTRGEPRRPLVGTAWERRGPGDAHGAEAGDYPGDPLRWWQWDYCALR